MVAKESDFANSIRRLFKNIRPKKIIETGTYLGTGTTTTIVVSLKRLAIKNATFYSIEVNPEHYYKASANLIQNNLSSYVKLLNGLSIPRKLLPTLEEIGDKCVNDIEFDDIFVDHPENERALRYYQETNYENLQDDLLGECLKKFDYSPDFVLLDSGGHMGNIEFNYLINQLRSECYIALDDIYHIKHHKDFLKIKKDSRFELLTSSKEKFGFCIAKFTPEQKDEENNINNIIWIRTDSIGDNILAASMLPHVRKKFEKAKITVVCQEHIAEIYKACPFVDDIVSFDRQRAYEDGEYRLCVIKQLQAINADITLNSVYSREPLTDIFAIGSRAKEKIAFSGNLCNISAEMRDMHKGYYTKLLESEEEHKPELERHRDFLKALGIDPPFLKPIIWTTPEDEKFANDFFRSNNLQPEKSIALFGGAQSKLRIYHLYGRALSQICNDNDFTVISFGSKMDYDINQQNLDAIGVRALNLCGKTTLRQTAALLKRCRLAVGAETGIAHVACAVGTPNVILLGGGHFGRFMPYSALTSVVCLPLKCYSCNWQCPYQKAHCISDILPDVIIEAIRKTLKQSSETPRVFVQANSLWNPQEGQPKLKALGQYLGLVNFEIISVGAEPYSIDVSDLNMQGEDLFGKGDLEGALDIFTKALDIVPDDAVTHNNLGVLYYNCGKKEKALNHYVKAVGLQPENITFQKNLADFYYFELERVEEALKIYNKILNENPEDLETLLVMGHICIKRNKVDNAIDFYNRVLEIDPRNASAIEALSKVRETVAQSFLDISRKDLPEHYTLGYGNIHRKLLAGPLKDYPLSDAEPVFLDTLTGKMNSIAKSSEAIPSLLASMLYYYPHQLPIEIDILQVPDWLQADYCAFLLSYPRCFLRQGEVDNYCRYIKRIFASFYKSLQQEPDSKTLQKLAQIITQNTCFIPLYFSKENLKDIYLHRAAIAELSLKTQGCELDFTFPQRCEERKRLRLGIYARVIAPGTEAFATLPLYEYLNREEFEVFLYVHQRNGNPVEIHAEQLADRFIELPENMKTSVEMIRADDLDVLFFSNNLTAVLNHAFILANHRLARFQCVHFCQPVTSGLKHIEYFFMGDLIQENGKEEEQYHEQIVNLEGSGICFDMSSSNTQPGAAIRRDQIGIPDNRTVFVSGANFFKIIPELRHLWARLLAKVPESVLVLYPFGPAWSSSYPKSIFRDHFESTLSKYNVKEERLIILDPLPKREDIKELLRHTDVYLDAVPYSGATSLLDPLEVGVPPVVMEGEELRCHQGAAILKELGIEELVAKTEEEYIKLACRLAINNEFRTELRNKIINRMQGTPPFLDPKGYARKISTALKNIVQSEIVQCETESNATSIQSITRSNDRDTMTMLN